MSNTEKMIHVARLPSFLIVPLISLTNNRDVACFVIVHEDISLLSSEYPKEYRVNVDKSALSQSHTGMPET